jgi:phage gp46-like protein
MIKCVSPVPDRRRLFWATQPDACGSNEVCGYACGRPGLSIRNICEEVDCNITIPVGCASSNKDESSISTTNWLRGIIINMLMTDGRNPDTPCGYRPGAQGGHWSESYITSGPTSIGTLLRTIPSTGRIQENINLIVAYAQATVERLIERGVAVSVDVKGSYIGGSRMQLDITVVGRQNVTARVGIAGARLSNGWVWQ